MIKTPILSLVLVLACAGLLAQQKQLASTPPMGWNSYNCFGAAVTEAEVKANADYMDEHMKSLGWEYIVVDYCWYYPHPPGSTQNNPPQYTLPKDNAPVPWMPMDEYGRLLPDPRKFPSSANGRGFKPLADYIHSKGLKFGIHIMRGIPRQAAWAKTPIAGANGVTADMVVDTASTCPWLNAMYGVDMAKDGAQAYYNSLIAMYESWGVDYIKADDIDLHENYPYRKQEVEAIRKALDFHNSDIVLSLSLNMKYENRRHVQANSQLWRISKDFWDDWKKLEEQFGLLNQWNATTGPGHWPDADMLQVGKISKRGPKGPERFSNFNKDEQLTHITLWMIARSPLMMGGHMPENTPFVKDLITNPEVIALNQRGRNQKQLSRKNGQVVWVSDLPGQVKNVALFNLLDTPQVITVTLKALGLKGPVAQRDLWERKSLGMAKNKVEHTVSPHGAKLVQLR